VIGCTTCRVCSCIVRDVQKMMSTYFVSSVQHFLAVGANLPLDSHKINRLPSSITFRSLILPPASFSIDEDKSFTVLRPRSIL
jgi:hypothetical protein